MEKILITGVTGFIGSHLAQTLSKSYEVYGLAKFSTSRDKRKLHDFLKDIVVVTGDIADYQSVYQTLRKVNPDIVVHLAAASHVSNSFDMPFLYVHSNVHGTLNIAHSLLELPDWQRKRLIYASTAEVYGIQQVQPIKEDAVLNPSSPYANTKSMTDTYLRMMNTVYKLHTTVMRNTNTYGRKLDDTFIVEYLINTMLRGDKVYVGAPDSIRDYMYVTDHVNAYVAAIEHPEIRGEAFNAAPADILTNKELTYKIADLVGYDKSQIVLGKYPPNYPRRPIESDQPFIHLDSSKIKKMLGWQPKVSLNDGLARTVEFWKNRAENQA